MVSLNLVDSFVILVPCLKTIASPPVDRVLPSKLNITCHRMSCLNNIQTQIPQLLGGDLIQVFIPILSQNKHVKMSFDGEIHYIVHLVQMFNQVNILSILNIQS